MRRTSFFCDTLRQGPGDTDTVGHQMLVRGAYIHPLAAGIYSLLPLGVRVTMKISAIMRAEMDRIGGQEVVMPVVHPAELWQATGRWQTMGAELAHFKDRGDHEMVLAMTHEEVVAEILHAHIHSYRQLPRLLYQIQTKYRDEPRARGGLIRAREFTMKDAYSAHASPEDLDVTYDRVYTAYTRIFARVGLPVIAVGSDVGVMGGSMAHEFMYLSEIGEDRIIICDTCGYAANQQTAVVRKATAAYEAPLPRQEIHTPGTTTIDALTALTLLPAAKTAKAVFFMAGERCIMAMVRGDMDVNETKLARAVGSTELRPATGDDIARIGAVPGFASPLNVTSATIVVDDTMAASPNLIGGANRPDYHVLNLNIPRDYQPAVITDITNAAPGDLCQSCGAPVRLARGVEVGNIFKLGTRYSRALGAQFQDEYGQLQDIIMGSYGIGVGRLMACLAQEYRDARSLLWPIAVAPFAIYLIGLDLERVDVRERADTLYNSLRDQELEVLYDDRDVRAGVKFNDADLLGIPLRVTVSARSLATDSIEVRQRARTDSALVPIADAVRYLTTEMGGQGSPI